MSQLLVEFSKKMIEQKNTYMPCKALRGDLRLVVSAGENWSADGKSYTCMVEWEALRDHAVVAWIGHSGHLVRVVIKDIIRPNVDSALSSRVSGKRPLTRSSTCLRGRLDVCILARDLPKIQSSRRDILREITHVHPVGYVAARSRNQLLNRTGRLTAGVSGVIWANRFWTRRAVARNVAAVAPKSASSSVSFGFHQ
jgi:hypothetical protein